MGRTFVSGAIMGVVLLITAAARSDVATQSPAAAGPATFVPMDIGQTNPGPPGALWHYSDLPPGEQAYVLRNANTGNSDQVNQAFATAVVEQAHGAAARDVGNQLGIDNLATEGVLP
jgi:hypothetical protein